MLINPNRVNEILVDCLYKKEEIVDGKPIIPYVGVQGVQGAIGFHPERLQSHKQEISDMIENLPKEIDSVEGLSFLNVCQDKEGNLWTGMHKTCDELIMLAIGLELLEFTMSKELWMMCPGGMPMIRVKHPSDPTYKDMSKYRNGRERSKVVQTWLHEFKKPFMDNLLEGETDSEKIVASLMRDFMLKHPSEITEAMVNRVILWLNSNTGRTFISKAYDVEVPAIVPELSLLRVWGNEFKQMVLNTIIYRAHDQTGLVSREYLDALDSGTGETPVIVADTLIGWLNSAVGRSFVRQAFNIEIPNVAPDGTE
ncbi:hypothetical protein ACFVS2_25900 [Brevibacillus sp. NPDC058079]|uniref:hypothetical protein n=1 Tax=Brevibacillus sp. NPDC058079 TaxID=3346330 RepID=UPI0036EBD231